MKYLKKIITNLKNIEMRCRWYSKEKIKFIDIEIFSFECEGFLNILHVQIAKFIFSIFVEEAEETL